MKLDYARQEGAADLDVMKTSKVVQVGIGSAQKVTLDLTRMGLGQFTLIDPDRVEDRNVTSQGYTAADAGHAKVHALRRHCWAINADIRVKSLEADFVRLSDDDVKEELADADLLLMTTDHHPAQARGALAGLVCDVPTLFASLYRRGRAGEIIYSYPGLTRACYRCITRDRYEYVARNRTSGTGNAAGSLPFAPMFVDGIVGHLVVAMLHHRKSVENPFARWMEQLGQRNFIQTRMDPDYRLGEEDIFGNVFGHGEQVFAFDTIWQSGHPDPHCPDCGGLGAVPVGARRSQSTELVTLDCGCVVSRDSTDRCPVCPACGKPTTPGPCYA